MAEVLIGSKECPIDKLMDVFKREDATQIELEKFPVISQWVEFARCLDITHELLDTFMCQIQQGHIERYEAIQLVLMDWIARHTEKATLGNMLSIVERNFKWEIVTDFLRKKIQTYARSLTDLDEISRKKLLDHQFVFLGRQTNLKFLQGFLSNETFDNAVKTIDNNFIVQVLHNNLRQFDKFQLPPESSHYTNRTVEIKRRLNAEIFQKTCDDIFIFEATLPDDLDLSVLVRPNAADASGAQVHSLSVRFILLEEESHFAEIVRQTKKPVHRIKYHENSLLWIRTIGSIRVIREFLSGEVEEIGEDNLINGTLSDFDSKPIAICGGPGTGKSVLMTSLANQMFQTYSERYAIFLNFPSMIRQQTFSDTTHKFVDRTRALAEIFGSISGMHKCVVPILEGLMNNQQAHFEIFLDRFDEIPFEKVKPAKHFLKRLLKYKNMRIYLAFSPTIQVELENLLQTVSCNISPFHKDDIEFFLSKKVDSQICQMVIKSVDLLVNNKYKHKGTAGSPLQCSMLAEVYLERKAKEDKSSTKILWSKRPIKTLTELYLNYMEIQFQKRGNQDFQLLKLLYYREAFNKLFYDNMDAQLIIQVLSKQIKQLTLSRTFFEPIVEHKTFSEFLMAQFIVENLKESTLIDRPTLCNFLYRTLLSICKPEDKNEFPAKSNDLENDTLESALVKKDSKENIYLDEAAVTQLINLGWDRTLENLQISLLKGQLAFRYSAICYFLNEIISNDKSLTLVTYRQESLVVCGKSHDLFSKLSKDFISKLLLSVSFSYPHVFRLTGQLFRETTGSIYAYIDPQTCQTILILAARQHDVQTFQYFCKSVEGNGSTNITAIRFPSDIIKNMVYEHTPLHEAARLGNLTVFEHLFNLYKSQIQSLSGLVQVCISGSSSNSKNVITNKNKILRLLSFENIKYNFKDIESSMLDGIHVTLFIKACDMIGYTLSEKDIKWLYKYVVYYFTSYDQMDVFVNWLISKDLTRLLIHFYDEQTTLVIDAIRQNVLGPHSLERIYNSQCFDLGVIVYCVTKCNNRYALIKKMVDLIGDISLDDSNDPTISHWATSMFEFDPMKYVTFDKSDRANMTQRLADHKITYAKRHGDDIIKLIRESQSITEQGQLGQIQYSPNDILGRGTFGTVYSGTLNGRPVAVKKIYFNAKQEGRVTQETKLLLECDGHENIIKCFYVQKSTYTILIALEICKLTLDQWVQRYRSADVKPQALQILHQTTKGLEYLHSKKIVHLDITPHNILLSPTLDDFKVKISDFGNSWDLSIDNTRSTLEDGAGTIEWMAPEVIKMTSRMQQNQAHSQKLTTAADIFSLGCVFYYVLSNGVHPFGDKEVVIKSNIQHYNPCINNGLLKEPRFIHLFYLMTNQNPNDRPTAAALLKHHIFWSEKIMLGFLVAVSNAADQPKVTSKISKIMDKIEKYPLLKPYYEPSTSKGWIRFLCVDVQKYVCGVGCKRKPYHGDLFFDLVRAIRNMQVHKQELPDNVQKAVGAVPNFFMKYWLKRFAIVFEIIWLHFETVKGDTSSALLEYYSEDYDFNREEISEKADKILAKYIRKQCTDMVLRGTTFM